MAISIGINGFGRIGRVALRIAISRPETFKLCGINARNADLDYMVYMIRYDSTFGRFQGELGTYEHGLIINGQKIPVFTEGDAASIPWGSCGAEYIIDATGAFCTAKKQVLTCKVVQKKSLFLHLQKMKKHLHSSWGSTIPVIRKICPLCPMHPARPTVWHLSVKYWKTIMELNMG